MRFKMIALAALALVGLFGLGCEQAEKAAGDAGAAVEETVEKAAELAEETTGGLMDKAAGMTEEAKALHAQAVAELADKKDELKVVQDKIAELGAQDLLSSDGKALKQNAERLTGEIGDLEKKLREMMAQDG